MAECLTCHQPGTPRGSCEVCHLTSATGTLQLDVGQTSRGAPARLRPTSDLFGDSHRPGFSTDHRAAATRADRTCAACHEESYCAACHAGAIRPLEFHPPEYLALHATEARRAASECSTCHRYQSFCVGCHERVGIGARAAGEWTPTSTRFHPEGWVSLGVGENRHGRAARQNLTACVSCHREDDCRPCHSADGAGLRVSPHPPGWAGSAQCEALDRGNRRMCLRCHVRADELGCAWRAGAR
ncbi:MAG: hypothetical protein R3B48_05435 [Kofleriaceae bacterium]